MLRAPYGFCVQETVLFWFLYLRIYKRMSGSLNIDLSAIQSNWELVGEGLAPGVENSAVVKANAYGLGVAPVSRALYAKGCRTFFVATLPEAQELKQFVGEDARIFILTGLRAGEEDACLLEGFVPVLSSLQQIWTWAKARDNFRADELQRLSNKKTNSAIKIDTGMHRLGLSEDEFVNLCADKDLLTRISPQLVMSHLACAGSPEHPLNQQQLSAFKRCAIQIKNVLPNIKLSLANSSGICLGSEFHFDLVRPGACLYGVNPTPDRRNPMASVVGLRLPVLQMKTIKGPASVGYDALYSIAADASKTIAIVAGGYGDGLFNHLSNRGYGYFAEKRVPLVGRVSMDSMAFDVSAIDEDQLAKIDDPHIDILNTFHSVDALAEEAGTIGYEVLTALGKRYHRHYHGLGHYPTPEN